MHRIVVGHPIFKPFMTEYKESYKDPLSGKLQSRGKPGASSLLEKKAGTHLMHDKACKAGAAAVLSSRAQKDRKLGVIVKGMSNYHNGKQVQLPKLPSRHLKNNLTVTNGDLSGKPTVATEKTEVQKGPAQPQKVEGGNAGRSTNAEAAGIRAAPEGTFRPGSPAAVGYGENKARYDIITGVQLYGDQYGGYRAGHRAVIETFQHQDDVANARSPYYNIITGQDPLAAQRSPWSQQRDVIQVRHS
ncbi:uncharacterized protein EV422DRAFT_515209 [Fimicolochytrium jonesii]|uniref:uncharacterized protein n=1 Tax=Fimicolochytrium jonesii TaxID=1396493 RepID=UPI0022FEDC61|nr:uncharacterized protein EV422DRAFT_515209 [Fimicolochytrium jonesii]KAI8826082.1 hypothetical protein EV422DRAFT_515209 [Fimicolochytrium jonesii]